MGQSSSIEWTEATWNPFTGCDKISPGCANCYAERMAKRLQAMEQPNYVNGFKLSIHSHTFDLPLAWKKPQMIFVNSMSDMFHKDVPLEILERLFEVMRKAHWHCFQILTKRAERLTELSSKLRWASNIWMGVTVENQNYVYRIEHLKKTKAFIKFVSFEPLLGPIKKVNLKGIDWAIVGGESGPRSRPMNPDWVYHIQRKCQKAHTPFFFKQWGGTNKKKTGRLLDGKTWDEMPAFADA